MSGKDELVRAFKELNVIRKERVELKSGRISDLYVDVRTAYGHPHVLKLMTDLIYEIMDKRTTCVASGGYGGVPLATAMAFRHDLFLTLVRDKPKAHGIGSILDGYIPISGDYVTPIDDVLTSGGSIRQIDEEINKTGATVVEPCVVVKRGDGEKYSRPVRYLLTEEDLVI